MKICKGTTRIVFLIGNYAYKFPRIKAWNKFLKGLLNNMSETFRYKYELKKKRSLLAPITFSSWGGFLVVMKRTVPIDQLDYDREIYSETFGTITHDLKIHNFGFYKDRLVIHDYADDHYNCSDCVFQMKRK